MSLGFSLAPTTTVSVLTFHVGKCRLAFLFLGIFGRRTIVFRLRVSINDAEAATAVVKRATKGIAVAIVRISAHGQIVLSRFARTPH
jgi:hypothetical protein